MTKRRSKRHTPEQIVRKLRDAEAMLRAIKGSGLFYCSRHDPDTINGNMIMTGLRIFICRNG